MDMTRRAILAAAAALAVCAAAPVGAQAQDKYITVASTTSTENSGLFKHLLPTFTKETGIAVRVVAVGTGQAIELARRGDADVLFVHHKPSEEKFVADGYGEARVDVMYNDYVLVGPKADVRGTDAVAAFKKIAADGATFASRGDDSGTHKAEQAIWQEAGIAVGKSGPDWYRELGSGMGATLNTAAQLPAYTLADRGTWISFANKGPLGIVVEGDQRLFNPYGVIVVSKDKHPHAKADPAQAFVDWLVSEKGQKSIADFKIGGQQLFFPNAKPVRGS